MGTYIFEKTTGMTAFFSDKEEILLCDYFNNGIVSEFITRLFDLGILIKNREVKRVETGIALQSLHIDITDSCPLKCTQCYKKESKDVFLDFDYFKGLIDEALRLKVFQIAIGGGEPLIHKRLIDMVRYVADTEMSVSVTTSGYGLDREKLADLISSGLNHIQISLNGTTEEVNRLSRDGYDYTINALKLLSERDISFGINFVVRKDNICDLENIILLAHKFGASNINLLRYKPNNYESHGDLELSSDEVEFLMKVVRKRSLVNITVDSAFTPFLMNITNGNVSANQSGCGALKTFINVTADGYFKPCSHMSLKEKANSIFEYYTKSDNKKCLDSIGYSGDAKCKVCEFNEFCFGCIAITEYKKGKLLKGESDCLFCRKCS